MNKGKGKCIVCGNDEIAEGKAVPFTVLCDDVQDIKYFAYVTAHACTHCGFIQLTSDYIENKSE